MSESSMEVLAGGTFVFKVGSAQKSFSLHSKLVTQHSRPLSALILGSMKEAEEGSVLLDDVEETTFVRFAEYIYGGGYNVPSPTILPTLSPNADQADQLDYSTELIPDVPYETIPDPPAEEPDWNTFHMAKKKTKSRRVPASASLSSFASFALPTLASVSFPKLIAQQVPHSPLDYTEILLCHAQLYVFADRYDVVGLKDLVLCQMHLALKSLSRVRNVVPTIEHIYENTPSMTNGKEPMRDLLAHLVAWEFKTLMEEESFREYFAKGGDFVTDVCRKVGFRLDE